MITVTRWKFVRVDTVFLFVPLYKVLNLFIVIFFSFLYRSFFFLICSITICCRSPRLRHWSAHKQLCQPILFFCCNFSFFLLNLFAFSILYKGASNAFFCLSRWKWNLWLLWSNVKCLSCFDGNFKHVFILLWDSGNTKFQQK